MTAAARILAAPEWAEIAQSLGFGGATQRPDRGSGEREGRHFTDGAEFTHDAVDDRARRAAGESPRQPRLVVARFADGDTHGFTNTGDIPFVYISVTSPPINFREAYSRDWELTDDNAQN